MLLRSQSSLCAPRLPSGRVAALDPLLTWLAAAQEDQAAAEGVHPGSLAGVVHDGGHAALPSAAAELAGRQLPRRAAALPQLPVVRCRGVTMLGGSLQRREVAGRGCSTPHPACILAGCLQPLHVGQHLHSAPGGQARGRVSEEGGACEMAGCRGGGAMADTLRAVSVNQHAKCTDGSLTSSPGLRSSDL